MPIAPRVEVGDAPSQHRCAIDDHVVGRVNELCRRQGRMLDLLDSGRNSCHHASCSQPARSGAHLPSVVEDAPPVLVVAAPIRRAYI